MRRWLIGITMALIISTFAASLGQAAGTYADPKFQAQWNAGEAITPNFWGPLATAHDGQQEPYKETSGGMRTVQYFDKGRMELTNGAVTNGLLATEIVKGQIQVGDATFQPKAPPAIPIAGDVDNPGPTYAQLSSTAAALLAPVGTQPGAVTFQGVTATGAIVTVGFTANGRSAWGGYDDATRHNLSGVFVDYRAKAGLATIGYAISEPFGATVKVAGQQRQVLIQVFERRVLTYTATNSPQFQVEMGNIGAHYYQWRYGTSLANAQASSGGPTGAALPRSDHYNCVDFPSQAAAQAYLRTYPDDPSKLDGDRNGIACDGSPAPFDRTPVPRT